MILAAKLNFLYPHIRPMPMGVKKSSIKMTVPVLAQKFVLGFG